MLLADLCTFLENFAPTPLAEDWDNVGLLVGQQQAQVARVLTCLTLSADVADEAVREQADLIVVHHPLPFRPLKRITDHTTEGGILLKLIRAGIAIYSPHTAFDSAADGINQRLALGLELNDIAPLVLEPSSATDVGGGRCGRLANQQPLRQLIATTKGFLKIEQVQYVGDADRPVQRVAIACGSGGEFLPRAAAQGCDVFVTGEARFHTCLEAEALGIALLLVGHYASERFGVVHLANVLSNQFPTLTVWPSRVERDPLRTC